MFGLTKKRKIRRQRAKQFKAESTVSAWEAFVRVVGIWPTITTIAFLGLIGAAMSIGERTIPYSLNEPIGQPIVARVDFTQDDPEQAAANKLAAREAVPNYYRVNNDLIDRIAGDLTAIFQAAQVESFELFQKHAAEAFWSPDAGLYRYLNNADEAKKTVFQNSLNSLKTALAKERIARPTAEERRDPPSTALEVVVLSTSETEKGEEVQEETIATIQLIQMVSKDAVAGRVQILLQKFPPDMRKTAGEVLTHRLSEQPTLVFDEKLTHERMAAKEKNAAPGVKSFEQGKPFVFPRYKEEDGLPQREELGLAPTDIELLTLEQQAYQNFLNSEDPEAVALRTQQRYEQIGTGVILAILCISLFVYVGLYQPRILEVRTRTIAFAGLLLACFFAVRLIDVRLTRPEFILTPVLLAASILTIAYPRRFACGATIIFVIMVSVVIRANMGITITLMAGGYVTALMLNHIRTRTKILTAGLLTGLLVATTSFAFGLIDRQELGFALSKAYIAAACAVLAALIIQGILPFVERIFKVATALTLLEYRDANRPLLQRLAREAPGTYNHSLVLGTMAEAACEAIGANGLLAHVGSLYHDIGKIQKREYFAENQEASINRHDKLTPTMSLLIILGHVKDGLELAKEYGLPRILHPFIAEHHGTTVVKYFHTMASEKQPKISSGKHDREVAEAEFRYPGPKPLSRETAILMLCDGVESAVRALPEPTAGRIETVVHQILQARLKDGQFDDCPITLKELHAVEDSLVKSLCRFYHGRVAYPKETKAAKESLATPEAAHDEIKEKEEHTEPAS